MTLKRLFRNILFYNDVCECVHCCILINMVLHHRVRHRDTDFGAQGDFFEI
jgi:hypothetical protein